MTTDFDDLIFRARKVFRNGLGVSVITQDNGLFETAQLGKDGKLLHDTAVDDLSSGDVTKFMQAVEGIRIVESADIQSKLREHFLLAQKIDQALFLGEDVSDEDEDRLEYLAYVISAELSKVGEG